MERALGLSKDCFIVRGHLRSAIYDTRRQTFSLLANRYADDLRAADGKSEAYVRAHLDSGLLEFALDNEFAYFWPAGLLDQFTDIPLVQEHPFPLSNAIVEGPGLPAPGWLNLLLKAGCRYFLIVVHETIGIDELEKYLSAARFDAVPTLELHLNGVSGLQAKKMRALMRQFPQLASLWVYKGKREQFFIVNEKPAAVTGLPFPGLAPAKSPDTMFVNLPLFIEANAHNPYLHRKIHIAGNGDIRNAPEDPRVFGNIHPVEDERQILQIVQSPDFQRFWNIPKDRIDVCRDCEFRYMCVDARLPEQRNDGSWYFTGECEYNPYICKWKEEDGHRPLAACGIRCDAAGFQVDEATLRTARQEIWEDAF